MNDARLVLRQIGYEARQFIRNPPAAVFAVAFPIMFLVVFSSLNSGTRIGYLGGVAYTQYYTPAIIAFGIIGATFTNLATSQSIRRDNGLLRRLRATPLPPWAYLAGVVGNAILVAIALTLATTAIGVLAYGVNFQGRWLGLAIDVAVGALAFCGLGLALVTVIPNGDSAPAITNFILLPLVFLSGTFYPVADDSGLAHVADIFPVRHFTSTMYAAFDPLHGGVGANIGDILVLLAWGGGGALMAARRFRWEPQRA